jgi:hypothetical protein
MTLYVNFVLVLCVHKLKNDACGFPSAFSHFTLLVPIPTYNLSLQELQATMAPSPNNKRPSRVATRAPRVTHASNLAAVERRAIVKLSKVSPPSRAMQIPILKQIAELLKRQKEILKGRTGKKGRGILKEVMEEHIKHFPWMTIKMVIHYIKTYPHEADFPTVIETHHLTVVRGMTDSSPAYSALVCNQVAPTVETTSDTIPAAVTDDDDSQDNSNRGGRPKGTTNASKKPLGILSVKPLTNARSRSRC